MHYVLDAGFILNVFGAFIAFFMPLFFLVHNGGVDQYFGFDNGRLRLIIEVKVLVERLVCVA